MKYLRFKFIVLIFRNLFYKLKYGKSIDFKSLKVGFEKGCVITIQNGTIKFGNMNYFTRFVNIEVYGGLIEIGDNVSFNKNCNIISRKKIKIGNDCIFGPAVSIYDHNHGIKLNTVSFSKQKYKSKEIIIGNNVWLGAGVVVLPGSSIGSNVVVGANSVVTGVLNSDSVYVGIPAKRIDAA